MSIITGYNDPIKIQLNYDMENNPISVEMQPESHVVLNGRITLIQIPDKFYRVQINGFTELYEYDNSEIQSNNYRVDYQTGIVMLHNSLEGQTITISKYWGRGIVLTPISRIYTRVENGNIVETLGQVIEDGSDALTAYGGIVQAINDAETKTTTLNNKILEGNTTEQNLDISILNADTKKTELQNTINSANTTKTNLDGSITLAQQTKQSLDTSITNGDISQIQNDILNLAGEGRTTETVKGNNTLIGVLSSLTTTVKTSIVNAVNSLKSEFDTHKAETVSKTVIITEPFNQTATTTVNLGFRPDTIQINALIRLSRYGSFGYADDGSVGFCKDYKVESDTWDIEGGRVVRFTYNSTNEIYGVANFTSTGVELVWTVMGELPDISGNRRLIITAYKHGSP